MTTTRSNLPVSAVEAAQATATATAPSTAPDIRPQDPPKSTTRVCAPKRHPAEDADAHHAMPDTPAPTDAAAAPAPADDKTDTRDDAVCAIWLEGDAAADGATSIGDAAADAAGDDYRGVAAFLLIGGVTAGAGAAVGALNGGHSSHSTAPVVKPDAPDSHVDPARPAVPPSAPVVALAHDTGPQDAHPVTSDATLTVSGIAPGATWSYSLDGGRTWIPGVDSSIPSSAFSDGPASVLVRQTDAQGNNSEPASLSFVMDTHVDAPALSLKQDTGTPGDGVTHDGTVSVSGLEDGATWAYSTDGGQHWIAGTGHETDTSALSDGPVSLLVRQTDLAGNSAQQSIGFTLDRAVAAIDLSDNPGVQSDLSDTVDAAAIQAGRPLTALTQPLSASDDIRQLQLTIGGMGLDSAHDQWVLDQAIGVDADVSASDVTIGSLHGLSYRNDPATHMLSIWKTDGSALTGTEAAEITNHLLVRNTDADPAQGERIVSLQQVDMADNLSDAAHVTVTVDTSIPQPTVFSVSDAQVIEGTSGTREMVFAVTRSGDASQAGSIHYAVDSAASTATSITGGAIAGNDYSGPADGTLDFAAGETTKLVKFTINGDHAREGDEALTLRIDSPTQGHIGNDTGVGHIHEIDITRLQAAYGLTDLNASLDGPAIQVRRSSDNAVMDIGFDSNGNLDRTALLNFVGQGAQDQGYVTRWYDQSGHGRDMVQSSADSQGVIVNGGQLLTRSDGTAAISFNSGHNGVSDDYMTANGVAATDWQSVAVYAKIQSEGLANGSLFNLGGSGDDRLSAHYPDDGRYYFDVNYNGHTGRVDEGMNDPNAMVGQPNDLLFEAHSGNTSAGSAAQNYSDAAQAIFDNGARVISGNTVQTPFSTGSEWNLARHGGAPGSPEENFYQQAMYSEFLVYLAKDNSTAAPQTILGTSGSDVLTYSGEYGITTIDGMGGDDWLYVSGNVDLDVGSLTGGMKGIEHIRMDNGAANLLTLTDATLSANGAPVLTIAMDAGDAVLLNGTRYDHNADSLQTLIIGNDQGNVIVSTSANDRMIGGAGADTFTWLPGQAGRDTIENFSAAQHDKLDLTQLLQGFTGATRDQFIHKEVDAQGQVTLQVDAQGHGDFTQPDLTIVLEHVAPADPITVMTHAGNWVL